MPVHVPILLSRPTAWCIVSPHQPLAYQSRAGEGLFSLSLDLTSCGALSHIAGALPAGDAASAFPCGGLAGEP